MSTIFVAGIDTDCGKTVATGLLARFLRRRGVNAVTAKLAQTGCVGISSDILFHRKLMGVPLFEADKKGLTCPYVLPFPASPHLSAGREGVQIRREKIEETAGELEKIFDTVLMEGVGGFLVPLSETLNAGDFVAAMGWPVILVTSPRLGSLNHTALTLEALKSRSIPVLGAVFNMGVVHDAEIAADSRLCIAKMLEGLGFPPVVADLPSIADFDAPPTPDFSELFGLSR